MAKSTPGMIEQLSHEVEAVAGEPVRQQVMMGAESLTPKTKPETIALWVRDAVDRLIGWQLKMHACRSWKTAAPIVPT
jgi:hypothetical protein